MGSSASQRHSVVVEIWVTTPQATSSSRSSARLQRLTGTPRVAGSSQATASAVVTTAAGNTRGTARPLAIGQAREPLLAEAFAPFGHGVDRDPKPPGDHLVGQARRGLEHDPSPHHLSVLGGLLAHQRFEVAALSRAQRDHQRAAPAASCHPAPLFGVHAGWWRAGVTLPDPVGHTATHSDQDDPRVDQDLAAPAPARPSAPALAGAGRCPRALPRPVRLHRRRASQRRGAAAVPAAVCRLGEPVRL